MESVEELTERLSSLTQAGSRGKLLPRGLARGMVWSEGELPPDSPNFSSDLTVDLLDHGYSVLGCALRLRSLNREAEILDISFRTAAESIEAAVRRGTRDEDRGFHLTVAAASFHLGHYAARSFSLLAEDREQLNLASVERLLVALMQRQLGELETLCLNWLSDDQHTDDGVAAALEGNDEFLISDASRVVVVRVFHRAIAEFEFAIRTGNSLYVERAVASLDDCIVASEKLRHVPLWWSSILARHLIDDLWDRSLHTRLPTGPDGDKWPELRKNFIDLLSQRDVAEIDLWPSQLTAATRVVDETDSLVVALPTSSGKTRIAELCILKCLAGGRRVVYVTPLRALSAQVEVTLGRTFRPLGFSVTSVYGASGVGAADVDTMQSASIVVATPEKLDFAIRQSPEVIDNVGLIVLDEGHMIGLNQREIRYEVLVQRLLRRPDSKGRRVVCLSAIFTEGDPFDAFTAWIRADREGDAIRSQWRPTRQRSATLEWQTSAARLEYRVRGEGVFVPRFIEQEDPRGRRTNAFPQNRRELLIATIGRFHDEGHSVLLYCPEKRSVESIAKSYLLAVKQGHAKSRLKEQAKSEIETALRIGTEWMGADHPALQALKVGIAVHHGQLPRPFLGELERLLRRKVIEVAISSPTLAQGVDLSFSVLVFNSLARAGETLPAKEFANVVGRVGRAYVDLDGIYCLPVWEDKLKNSDARRKKQTGRISDFYKLVDQAHNRHMESGLFLLIKLCLDLLTRRFGVEDGSLVEYVLNQQTAVDDLTKSEHDDAPMLGVVLAELDAGVLSLLENLDCDIGEVAALLDEALRSSYWERRLAVMGLDAEKQKALLHGRARHIWQRTSKAQRVGFFAASVGTEAGLHIADNANRLGGLLELCTTAIEQNDATSFSTACGDLAKELFDVYPFHPRTLDDDWSESQWRNILATWIGGEPLSKVTDSAGIAFVQEGLVFRLVWAIEAVRIILAALKGNREGEDEETDVERETYVAICLTYGVPTIAAARILEAGMESRLLAVRIVSDLGLTFNSRDSMLLWLESVTASEPLKFSEHERAIWQKFVANNEQDAKTWSRQVEKVEFELSNQWSVDSGLTVRILSDHEGNANVYSSDFDLLGKVSTTVQGKSSTIGIVRSDNEIQIQRYGPLQLSMPAWLRELFDD